MQNFFSFYTWLGIAQSVYVNFFGIACLARTLGLGHVVDILGHVDQRRSVFVSYFRVTWIERGNGQDIRWPLGAIAPQVRRALEPHGHAGVVFGILGQLYVP